MENQKEKLDWPGIISDWERTGFSQVAYCRANNINYNQFIYQKMKIDRKARKAATHTFLPVKVSTGHTAEPKKQARDITIRISNQIELVVPADQLTLSVLFKSLGVSLCSS